MVAYSLFSSAVSAMRAHSTKFDSIGGNIANSTTPGYKANRVRFQEIVGGRSRGSAATGLLGVQPFQQIFRNREGDVGWSGQALDGALHGRGFFVTSTDLRPLERTLEFTDAGRFSRTVLSDGGDEEVYLTDIKGNYLLGWPFDATEGGFGIDTGSIASLRPIRVDRNGNTFEANKTTRAELSINLPATAAAGETHSFDIPIYDGTGDDDNADDTRRLVATFTKQATDNTWELTVSGTNGTVSAPATQPMSVVFDADGKIASVNGAADATVDLTLDWTAPSVSTSLTLNLGGSTQFNNAARRLDLRTDGNPQGSLTSVRLGDKGNVIGTFSNGLQRPLARIAVADFVEPNRLLETGLTHFKVGPNSGDIQLIDLDQTDRVSFTGSALEQSTTDLANEFADMIVTQRAYSSAATALRTVDEMVRIVTGLKS